MKHRHICFVGAWQRPPPDIYFMGSLKDKKILMIIAFKDFRDEEYFIPKQVFDNEGIDVTTASSQLGTAIGSKGGYTNVDLVVEDTKVDDYDAIVFVGGKGAHQHIGDDKFHKLAQQAVIQGKILGAICIAPAILAKAGVLKQKQATVWSDIADKSAVKILEENGAAYSDKPLVQDKKIITSNSPAAAQQFGRKIVQILTEKA